MAEKRDQFMKLSKTMRTVTNQFEDDNENENERYYCEQCSQSKISSQIIKYVDTIKQKALQICEQCLDKSIKSEDDLQLKMEKDMEQLQLHIAQIDKEIIKQTSVLQKEDLEKYKQQNLEVDLKLIELEKVKKVQDQELLKLKDSVLKLETEESEYWRQINKYESKLVRLEEKNQQADNNLQILNEEIERINNLNVINDVFYIFCNEQATTINNLIIGKKLDQDNVNWDDTNAGLGQIAVLLTYLFNKFQYTPKLIKYFQCSGSFSYVTPLVSESNKEEKYNLFGPCKEKEEETKFNKAMGLMLNEFKLFSGFLAKSPDMLQKKIHIELPHKILENDYIEDTCLNTQYHKALKWDRWTQAVKYLLVDIKYIIEKNSLHDAKAELEYITEI